MQGFRVWLEGPNGAGFGSPHFEKRERAEAAAAEMQGLWNGRPKVEVRTDKWPTGVSGYFGDELTARPL